jgi:hypothetical protein
MSTLTDTQARTHTRAMLAALSSLPLASVRLADTDGGGRPAADTLTYRWVSDEARGEGGRAGGTWRRAREVAVLVEAFGSSAVAGLRRAADLLTADAAERLPFVAAGLSVRNVGPVQDRTAVLGDTWEPRADLQLVVGYVRAQTAGGAPAAESVTLETEDGPFYITNLPPGA